MDTSTHVTYQPTIVLDDMLKVLKAAEQRKAARDADPRGFDFLLASPDAWKRFRELTNTQDVWPFGSGAVAGCPVRLHDVLPSDTIYAMKFTIVDDFGYLVRGMRVVYVVKLPAKDGGKDE